MNMQLRDDITYGGNIQFVHREVIFNEAGQTVDQRQHFALLLRPESIKFRLVTLGHQDKPGIERVAVQQQQAAAVAAKQMTIGCQSVMKLEGHDVPYSVSLLRYLLIIPLSPWERVGVRGYGGLLRQAFKKIDHPGLHGIFRADDQQVFGLDQVLEDGGAVAQLVDRGADIGADGLIDQLVMVMP